MRNRFVYLEMQIILLFMLAGKPNDLFYLKHRLQRLFIVTAKENLAERWAKIVVISQHAKLHPHYCCTAVSLEGSGRNSVPHGCSYRR